MDGRQNRERDPDKRSSSADQVSPLCLVEQGYPICGARDERPHAGQQQQLVDQLGHESKEATEVGAQCSCLRAPLA